MIKSVLKEYGSEWAINRTLYSAKLKSLRFLPHTESLYEKKTAYPKRLDLFYIDIDALSHFIRNLDENSIEGLITTADKACNGIIKGFSSLDLNYGWTLDWQLNPITGKRCDEKAKWYRIPDFDQERGDIKVIWEASRFSHFITLARAYLLTKNVKYYESFSEQLSDWLTRNPYGYGANFKCGQECSFRMINTLLAYTIFKNAGVTTDKDASNVKDLVDRCYRKVLSNFFYAYKCIKNNHTISELMGMIAGAWCCADQDQLMKAMLLMDKVIAEQFTEDGGYKQFSFNYQRLALQDLECVMAMEERLGEHLSEESKERIKNAAVLMYQCQDESGDMPNYGSNDGALVFPLTSCGYRDFRPVINTAYALATGQQIYTAGIFQEELIWFSGYKRLDHFPKASIDRHSVQFEKAGLFTLHEKQSWAMIVLNQYTSRPAHMDQLHFDLWINGSNVFCDAGTYSYASEESKKLVNNSSHNTAVVDGKNQMNTQGPFMIYDWTKRKLGKTEDTIFEGLMLSKNAYTHVRRVQFEDGRYKITDRVDGDNDYHVLFHTPCEVKVFEHTVEIYDKEKRICTISTDGEMTIEPAIRSIYYLESTGIRCISISNKGQKIIHTEINTDGEKNNG